MYNYVRLRLPVDVHRHVCIPHTLSMITFVAIYVDLRECAHEDASIHIFAFE